MPREFLKDKTRIKIEDVSVFNVIPLSLYTCLQKNAYVSKTKIKKGTPLFYNMCIHTFCVCIMSERSINSTCVHLSCHVTLKYVYGVSCIVYLVSCIVYLVSCILHRISCIVYLVSCILYRVSCNVHRQAKLSSVSCYGLYFQCCSVVLILYL